MFNNNTYTDFRMADENVLISSSVIQVRKHNQNVTKIDINWLFG